MADSLPYANPRRRSPAVAVILKGWPRLSETFIAQEVQALERRGLRLRLYSLRHPTDRHIHEVNRAVGAPVVYLPEYLWQEPGRVFRGWLKARRLPAYHAAKRIWLRDLRRDLTPNRVRRFGQALVLAAELAPDIEHLHAHFLHTPASVARYAALMRGLRWSVSAHAKDIWTIPDWEKTEKLQDAAWAVACTAAGRDHLGACSPGRTVELVHHGIDVTRFPPAPRRGPRDGRDPAQPVILLSVGRAVAKKGYDDLLTALSLLPRDRHWRFVHVGGGPLLPALKDQAKRLGLGRLIDWRGAQPEGEVRKAYAAADLFVLASRVTADGDRDGIPNVIAEAMSQGLAVVATTAGAIPELVIAGESGVLVPAQDPPALAAALAALIADAGRRNALGLAGEARVRRDFPAARGFDRIATLLSGSLACVSPSMPR
ncbi:MAG TPA: glycosyltransferase [Alphaproteobacteria bacterium]